MNLSIPNDVILGLLVALLSVVLPILLSFLAPTPSAPLDLAALGALLQRLRTSGKLPPATEAQVRMLAADKIVEAVKMLRIQTNLNLKEALQLARAMAAGHLPPPEATPSGRAASAAQRAPSTLNSEVQSLMQNGETAAAVQLLQAQTGLSWSEAEQILAAWEEGKL